MADVRIDTLGGKHILYDRSSTAHYGRGGVRTRPWMNPTFATQCDDFFTELITKMGSHAGLTVDKVLTGGVSRAGSGSSLHHQNRAFDLDAFLFSDSTNWVANTFPQRPHLYLGIEAVLRKHFGTVLSYDYNRDHEDHFHFDNGTSVGFKKAAKSHVIFVQNAVALVFQVAIGRDGVWGPQTEAAVNKVRGDLGIGGLSTKANWLEFLDAIAENALANEKAIDDDVIVTEPDRCECCGRPF